MSADEQRDAFGDVTIAQAWWTLAGFGLALASGTIFLGSLTSYSSELVFEEDKRVFEVESKVLVHIKLAAAAQRCAAVEEMLRWLMDRNARMAKSLALTDPKVARCVHRAPSQIAP